MPFGFVIDDDGADKSAAGGAARFAHDLADSPLDPGHRQRCLACRVLEEDYSCVGLVPTPLPASCERWLIEQLPPDIEQLRGYVLRKAIDDYSYDGRLGEELRSQGLLAAAEPFVRHYGPFFRRYTVSSSQILEEIFCAGAIHPAHALAILLHLGAISIDGEEPVALETGAALSELMQAPASRIERTRCTLEKSADPQGDPALVALRRLLRALWAGFVLDANVLVLTPAANAPENETT